MLEREGLQIKKEEREECKEFLNDLFISLGLDKIRMIERNVYTLTKDSQFFKEHYFETNQALHYRQTNLLPKISERIKESKWAEHDLLNNFNPESFFQVGHKFESIPDIEKLFGEKEIRNFILEEGKVCLIYFWCYYKSISKKQLKQLEDIYGKNNWEGNVKFLTFNLNANREQTFKFIKNLHLHRMEHFFVDQKKHPDHPMIKFEETHGSNSCILVNNENIIDYCGNLYNLDLEDKINLMLERNLSNSGIYTIPYMIDLEEKEILKNIVKNIFEYTEVSYCNSELDFFRENEIKYDCDTASAKSKKTSNTPVLQSAQKKKHVKGHISPIKNEKFSCDIANFKKKLSMSLNPSKITLQAPHLTEARITINKHFTTGNSNNIYYSGEVFYKCHKDDENELLKLFTDLDKLKDINFNKEIVETVEFFYGEKCENCRCFLYDIDDPENVYPQFICPNTNVFFCLDCGNEMSNIDSRKKIHCYFLYLITPLTKYYMKYIIKHNVTTKFDLEFKHFIENKNFEYVIKDLKVHQHIKCEGCFTFPVKTNRWKCCNCEYRNICDICMGVINKNIYPFYDEIALNLKVAGCDAKAHVFMKIIFDAPIYK